MITINIFFLCLGWWGHFLAWSNICRQGQEPSYNTYLLSTWYFISAVFYFFWVNFWKFSFQRSALSHLFHVREYISITTNFAGAITFSRVTQSKIALIKTVRMYIHDFDNSSPFWCLSFWWASFWWVSLYQV